MKSLISSVREVFEKNIYRQKIIRNQKSETSPIWMYSLPQPTYRSGSSLCAASSNHEVILYHEKPLEIVKQYCSNLKQLLLFLM